MPSNYSIAKQLKRLGEYLAICGSDPGQYAGAAFLIQGVRGQRVDQLYLEGRLHEIELNEDVARVIEEICLHGTPKQLESIKAHSGGKADLALLPNCGHSPHRDQREATLAAIKRHLARIRVSA